MAEVLLFGRRAQAWLAACGSRRGVRVSTDSAEDAALWVVDADGQLPLFSGDSAVVLCGAGVSDLAGTARTLACSGIWLATSDPERWLRRLVDAMAAGASVADALASVGALAYDGSVPDPADDWWRRLDVLRPRTHPVRRPDLDRAEAMPSPDDLDGDGALPSGGEPTPSPWPEISGSADEADGDKGPHANPQEPLTPTPSPPAADAVPPPDIATLERDRRRLVAEFLVAGRPTRRVLPPMARTDLAVSVAIPKRGQAAGRDSIDLSRPKDAEVVVLDIVASGPWPAPLIKQVWVPVVEVGQPSTMAVFQLDAPGEGELLTIQLDVLQDGRPLQRASLAVVARATALPGDRVRMITATTSAGPFPRSVLSSPTEPATQPHPDRPATVLAPQAERDPAERPASITLDATGSELVELKSGGRMTLASAEDVLASLSLLLSRTLGATDAPEGLADERARALLVELARHGTLLKEKLAPLGLPDDAPLDLLVQPGTTLLPLELVYDGPPPTASAQVCKHGHGKPCRGPSVARVCPFAFWGLKRSICRTVLLAPGRVPPPVAPLALTPLLYAATDIADVNPPPGPLPSQALRDAASKLAGDLTQVGSWPAWRRAVRQHRPALLLLLAHSVESGAGHVLQIGRHSQLSSIDLRSADLLARDGTPPLVVLVACASATAGDAFGSFHSALTSRGAAAVVGTLAKLNGPQGARAAAAVLKSLHDAASEGKATLGAALADARRDLLAKGLLVGLLLVSHGEVNTVVTR